MLDLTQPEDLLRAYVKVRSSLKPDEIFFAWSGNVYSVIPGQRNRLLFAIEGYNVGRCIEIKGGYQHLMREVTLYKNPASGEILEQWQNPFTEQKVKVIHVWNDPVNQQYMVDGPYGKFTLPITQVGEDRLCASIDIMLAYPSPLPRTQYPQYSQSDLYQGAEMFQFFFSRSELENPDLDSIPCEISWTRLGPWLPWMEMADRPGNLLYQCSGYKVTDGYEALPADVRGYVEQRQPKYLHAPDQFTRPNETSWTYFKKYLEQKGA
ncbi:DUF1838 family protein [Dictyobacter aurantiacus]|uniref:DUF1838 domain-containing protein n=1 Tax=Dictyobacter aurantiacus TaxID=1936993 RepID=A0A401ZE29_9CHLR|nr:DUF1838 family protein [Dictyobacter aurantiacus]GCE05089.1 hypothetical protein KDAU_24180 [Dictyobacter aurantiacus]